MRAESMAPDVAQTVPDLAPRAYLRSALAVARSAKRREYVVVHFGSGSFFRTDKLGAITARALIDGRSAAEAMDLVERIEAGAGERAWRLIAGIGARGAMTLVPRLHSGRRWWLRRLAAGCISIGLSGLAPVTRIAPISLLAWIYKLLPFTPVGSHVARSSGSMISASLRSSGYADRSEPWLLDMSRRCAAEAPRNWFFMYVSTLLSRNRLRMLADRLVDRSSADSLVASMQSTGAAIQVFLHSPLCIGVPSVARMRGESLVRVVVGDAHGLNVSARTEPMHYFGDSPDEVVNVEDPLALGLLLRQLKAGRSIAMALDRIADERRPIAVIDFVGHAFPRNDGPAWLAVRSGRPVVFWYTHSSPSGVVITTQSLLRPDDSLPLDQRVSALSTQLYAQAEAAVRAHPEAWSGWSYLGRLRSSRKR